LVGSYLIFAGVVLALASHLFDRDSFLACSPVSASGVLLLYGPVLWSWAATLVLWFAPVALALVNLFRSKPGLKLKVAALAFPMLVFLFGYLPSGPVSTPVSLRFVRYYKEGPKRPADFPDYLQAPPWAREVRYKGGTNPYLLFVARDPFPATKTLGFIKEKLEQAGWKPLHYDLLNPSSPSSQLEGWRDVVNEAKGIRYSSWSGYWMNDDIKSVHVRLHYYCSAATAGDMNTVRCQLYQSDWANGFVELYRCVHPNNFQ